MERIEKGRAEGFVSIIIGLMKDRILTKESRAKRINMSENENKKGFLKKVSVFEGSFFISETNFRFQK